MLLSPCLFILEEPCVVGGLEALLFLPKVDFLPKWQLSEESPDLSFHSPCIDPRCQKRACDPWTQFPPNPGNAEQSVALLKSPIQVAARARGAVEEIDKFIALSLPGFSAGRRGCSCSQRTSMSVCCWPQKWALLAMHVTNGSNIIWSSPAGSPGAI